MSKYYYITCIPTWQQSSKITTTARQCSKTVSASVNPKTLYIYWTYHGIIGPLIKYDKGLTIIDEKKSG